MVTRYQLQIGWKPVAPSTDAFAELEKRLLTDPDSDIRNGDIGEPSSEEASED
jgi:hypothetical protein